MRIYVSCPMSVPEEKLEEVIKHLFNAHPTNQVRWWKRGTTYNEERFIKECDLFVVILPRMTWTCQSQGIPRGTRSEIILATQYQKPIGLAYWSVSEGLAIYSTVVKAVGVAGLGGTRDKLLKASTTLPTYELSTSNPGTIEPRETKQLDLFKDLDLNPAVLLLKRSA